VATGIEECPDVVVRVAKDKDRFTDQVEFHVVPVLGYLFQAACRDPRTGKQTFDLEPKELRIDVSALGNKEPSQAPTFRHVGTDRRMSQIPCDNHDATTTFLFDSIC
jgi:hypothetical protein